MSEQSLEEKSRSIIDGEIIKALKGEPNDLVPQDNKLSAIDIILAHSFPYGKHENRFPKFRMNSPKKDYVLNVELTKILFVLNVKEEN